MQSSTADKISIGFTVGQRAADECPEDSSGLNGSEAEVLSGALSMES